MLRIIGAQTLISALVDIHPEHLPQVLLDGVAGAGAGWQTIIQYSRAVARLIFQCLSNQTQTRKDYTVLPNTIYWTINKHININRTNENQHELEKLALNLHRLAAVPSVLESL